MSEIARCKICQNEKIIFYYGCCQACYREMSSKYKFYKLKRGMSLKKIENDNHREIVKSAMWYKKSIKEIANINEMTTQNVCHIINKYCDKCDENGCKKKVKK